MRVDLFGLVMEAPSVTLYLWSSWRCSAIEHKLYEPAFYSTVISDWGTSILAAKELGDRVVAIAVCRLLGLGHAPTLL